jgi:hypothetical protein
MPALNLPVMPGSFMFHDGNGNYIELYLSTEWQEFFRTLFDRVGGVNSFNSDDISNLMLSSTVPDCSSIETRIKSLEILINTFTESKDCDLEMKKLEVFTAADPSNNKKEDVRNTYRYAMLVS